MPFPDFFGALEAFAVSERFRAEAYEKAGPENRALAKDHIAFLHSFWGEGHMVGKRLQGKLSGGKAYELSSQGADWLVLFLAPGFASAPELIAVLMPALLAGVSRIAVCLQVERTEDEISPVALAALDLLGLDEVYFLAPERMREFFSEALRSNRQKQGRVIGLGFSLDDFTATGDSFLIFPSRLRLGIRPGAYAEKILQAHPKAELVAVSGLEDLNGPFDAFFCQEDDGRAGEYPVFLILRPGQEHLWLWESLDPAFFVNSRLILS